MLFDLTWLAEGQTFPPASELERLQTYRDNRALYDGKSEEVLKAYDARIQGIMNRFADLSGFNAKDFTSFGLDLNYFQLITLKTCDMVAGEPPTITLGSERESDDEKLAETRSRSQFDVKIFDLLCDVSRYGDGIARIFKNGTTGKNDVVINSPSIWFPIVSYENYKEYMQHVLAWVQCENPSEQNEHKKRYVLKAQVHYKGFYESIAFRLKDPTSGNYASYSGLNINAKTYTIGEMIDASKRVETGLKDFAVIHFSNVQTSDSCFGINDYDRVCSIIAELQVRYMLESIILDKHSCPTPYVPDSGRVQLPSGEWSFVAGGAIAIQKDDAIPGYMTWDASLQANHTQIEKLEAHLYSLSEMGAVINDDAFGASQGFEALETRMTNARLKARRMSNRLTYPTKKMLCMLAESDGLRITPDELSIFWNDGLPSNEYRETEIATRKLSFQDPVTINMEHFGKNLQEAEMIEERKRQYTSNAFTIFNEEDDNDYNKNGGDAE